jgi:NAD(P)H-nitrite reductase large subunit
MRAVLLQVLVALLVVAAALAAYDRLVIRPAQIVGVVDVGEVYRQKEAEFTLILTKAGSDDERQKAMVMARAFAQRLPIALEELPRECGCLVVLKSAVAGPTPRTLDLTAHLKRKVEAP